ncbi:MAG: class I SAM-dependent methyltransferase [Planctomycetes bacterium]|nr:class I SAM-dependent methyltransferase [Planctomycetota bacterium]
MSDSESYSSARASARQRQLRDQYEAEERAGHYASRRWIETEHARKTNAWEMRTVDDLLKGVGPVGTLLDLPCGHGRFTELLDKHANRLIQGDLAAAMLQRRVGVAGEAIQGSLFELPVQSHVVDLAFCFRVLHHFPEDNLRARVLAELGRVSRRWVLATYYDARSFPVWRDRIRGRLRTLTSCTHGTFAKEASAAGLRIVARRYRLRWFSQQVVVLLEKE